MNSNVQNAIVTLGFREVWMADFEFGSLPGERPDPVCAVFHEFLSGRTLRLWQNELKAMRTPPFELSDSSLYVAYVASAEFGCHLVLGWPLPTRVFDAFSEFRVLTNGLELPAGRSLLGALTYFGLDSMGADEKEQMRALAMRGGPWRPDEQAALLAYCESDVMALVRLFPELLLRVLERGASPAQAAGQALLRGRYMCAVAHMEATGIPIDVPIYTRLRTQWESLKTRLVKAVDAEYGVFEGTSFVRARFEAFIEREGMAWPRSDSGTIDLTDSTFREMTRAYPHLAPLRELRHALSQLRLNDLAIGRDGRNRTSLWAFSTRTGRNAPSNSRSVFGPSVWLRGLIRPAPGYGLVYVDFSSQEIGIAAALSGDPALMDAYESGDPYLGFAIQSGLAPQGATKLSHASVRQLCKAVVLGVQYGMSERGLSLRLGISLVEARSLLDRHRRTYPRFWEWSDAAIDHAVLCRVLPTTFGWPIHIDQTLHPRSLRNFPMQANGAEMLRLACCFGAEEGLTLCAPIHDAILLEAPLDKLEDHAIQLRNCMRTASSTVLDGFPLDTDVEFIRAPDRYMDERGIQMWNRVIGMLNE